MAGTLLFHSARQLERVKRETSHPRNAHRAAVNYGCIDQPQKNVWKAGRRKLYNPTQYMLPILTKREKGMLQRGRKRKEEVFRQGNKEENGGMERKAEAGSDTSLMMQWRHASLSSLSLSLSLSPVFDLPILQSLPLRIPFTILVSRCSMFLPSPRFLRSTSPVCESFFESQFRLRMKSGPCRGSFCRKRFEYNWMKLAR